MRTADPEKSANPALSLLGTVLTNKKVHQAIASHLVPGNPFLKSQAGQAATKLIVDGISNLTAKEIDKMAPKLPEQTTSSTTTLGPAEFVIKQRKRGDE